MYHHVLFPITATGSSHWDGFKSFGIAMQDWALSDLRKFNFRFKKSDRTRNTVVCIEHMRIPDALLRSMQHILW